MYLKKNQFFLYWYIMSKWIDKKLYNSKFGRDIMNGLCEDPMMEQPCDEFYNACDEISENQISSDLNDDFNINSNINDAEIQDAEIQDVDKYVDPDAEIEDDNAEIVNGGKSRRRRRKSKKTKKGGKRKKTKKGGRRKSRKIRKIKTRRK